MNNKVIKFHFYKNEKTFTDKLIKFITKSKYSHVEIELDNRWYSASFRDRSIRVKNIEYNPNSWKTYEFPIFFTQYKLVELYFENRFCKYNIFDILISKTLNFHDDKRYTSAEICGQIAKMLHLIPIDTQINKLNAGKLEKLLSKNMHR